MTHRARRVCFATLACIAVLGPAAAAQADPVTVMTRNVYLGGDITRPLEATAGLSGTAALIAFGRANHQSRNVVENTNFSERAQAARREIAATRARPDRPAGGRAVDAAARCNSDPELASRVPNAPTVTGDWLADRCAATSPLSVWTTASSTSRSESDVEGPAFASFPGDGTGRDAAADDARRDAQARRPRRSRSRTAAAGSYNGARRRSPSAASSSSSSAATTGPTCKRRRSSASASSTRTWSRSSSLRRARAGPGDAGRSGQRAGPSTSSRSATATATRSTTPPSRPMSRRRRTRRRTRRSPAAGDFTDTWLQHATARGGLTSGLSEFVNDADLSGIDHRIDFVFAKHAKRMARCTVDSAWIVGRDAQHPRRPVGVRSHGRRRPAAARRARARGAA